MRRGREERGRGRGRGGKQVLDSSHVVEAVWNGAFEAVEVEIAATRGKRNRMAVVRWLFG